MQFKNFSFKTSDGCELWVNRWSPDEGQEIKAIIQLHHGLAEHTLRYDRFGNILAENGYVLNAYDMRGHGRTGEIAVKNNTGLMGKLAEKNGFQRVVSDLKEMIDFDKKEFPDKPVVLFGHSFGSFISQAYIEQFGNDINSCILCGTAGPRNFLINTSKPLVSLISSIKGENTVIPLLDKLAFGSYNKRFKDSKSKNAWLSKNEMNVSNYEMDNWCGIPLTSSFFKDMMCGLKYIHNSKNIKKIPTNLPVFFIYGSDDPVGSYGKTIEKLAGIYKKNGMENVSVKSYAGLRHEILNEIECEEVEKDVLSWLENTLTTNSKS